MFGPDDSSDAACWDKPVRNQSANAKTRSYNNKNKRKLRKETKKCDLVLQQHIFLADEALIISQASLN